MASDLQREYHYVDDHGHRVGPVTIETIKQLLEDGSIDGLTEVCCPQLGPDEWKPLGEIPELKQALLSAHQDDEEEEEEDVTFDHVVDVSNTSAATDSNGSVASAAVTSNGSSSSAQTYFYADDSGVQRGPIEPSAFGPLAAAGYLHASTLVWGPPMGNWEPISNVPQLSAIVASALSSGPGRPINAHDQSTSAAAGDEADDDTPMAGGVSEADAGSGASSSAAAADTASATAAADGSAGGKNNKRKREKEKGSGGGGWKAAKVNPWVYVIGLPPDVTEEEVAAHFRKAGVIKLDPVTQKPRIKLYREPSTGVLKGDGSVCYMAEASVELAVQLLDGLDLRPGVPLIVEPAQFERKEGHAGAAPAKKKRKGALTKEEQAARIKALEQRVALSWAEEGDESIGVHTIVLKHMFSPQEMQDAAAKDELAAEVAEEAGKIGDIAKLSLFSKHPEGVIMIKFKSSGAAAEAISTFNGRWFGGRQIVCQFYDGVTDYRVKDVDTSAAADEEAKRLDEFGKWLESGGE